MSEPVIEGLIPGAGIEGGEVMIRCSGFDFARYDQARAMFGGVETRLVSASSQLVVAPVPTDTLLYGKIAVTLLNANSISDGKEFVIGQKIAENLHPVSNPAVDRDTGAVYTTLSGSRGQKVPVSVYKISDGESEPFLSDLVNPTAIAFNPDGEMFITGRYEGSVYRVTPFKEAEVFAQNLGIATGIAFDHDGRMFVGDRNGTIYLVGENGESTAFAAMEASIAARSEEHTSELQSLRHLVCRLLLEKKKEVAEQVFDAPVRVGYPERDRFCGLIEDIQRPSWTAASGVALFAMRAQIVDTRLAAGKRD